MSRDHWTNSCDFIRSYVGPNVSRGDAAALRNAIAEVIGIPNKHLSQMLGDQFHANEEEATRRFMNHLSASLVEVKP